MKCLSVRQPWASIIASGYKRYEFRTWATAYRGPLLICASAGFTKEERTDALGLFQAPALFQKMKEVWIHPPHRSPVSVRTLPLGLAVCVVDLVACIPARKIPKQERERCPEIYDGRDEGFAWELANPKPLQREVFVKGQLGLWDWTGEPIL